MVEWVPEDAFGRLHREGNRSDGYEHILEKFFDIALTKDLVPMRKGTKLVLVDIPGINEANSVIKYKDNVAETWMSFDGVIVNTVQGLCCGNLDVV